jgi:hypothetical protein
MSGPQLQVLGQVLRGLFGPDSSLGTTLPEVAEALAAEGVRVPGEALVAELRGASAAEYDKLPAERKWGPMIYFDEEDGGGAGAIGAI